MQRTVVKFSGNRFCGYVREDDRNDIPFRCSNGEGMYVFCTRCGRHMIFVSEKLVWNCECGSEVDEDRVEEYAFRKFRQEMKGN